MPRTGRRRGLPDTRGQILHVAAAQFGTSGYEATTLRKVAADAGVDPALIRRFFGNKEGLFTQVAASVFRPDEAIAALLQGPRGAWGSGWQPTSSACSATCTGQDRRSPSSVPPSPASTPRP